MTTVDIEELIAIKDRHRRATAFALFHNAHPEVYREIVRLAREAKRAGRRKIGMMLLLNVVRWYLEIERPTGDFKINNNFSPYYARLVMRQEPELEHFFELRESMADKER